jgi:hypothetical protein
MKSSIMEKATLNNGVEMPFIGFGIYPDFVGGVIHKRPTTRLRCTT